MRLSSRKTKIFYGFWIVLASFFCLFTTSGVVYYGYSIFLGPIQCDLRWSRAATSFGFTMMIMVQAFAAPFGGRFVDRFGPKKIIVFGGLILGLGLALLSFSSSLWYFYGVYMIVGISFMATGMIPISHIISNWFIKRRGTALGIAAVGMGLGGTFMSQIIGNILIPNFGWRGAYLVLAILSLGLIIPIVLFVIKTKPQDKGLRAYGAEALATVEIVHTSPQQAEIWRWNIALKTSTFWLITISFMMVQTHVGIIQHQISHLTDIGFPVDAAVTALSAVGLASATGKFAFGYLSDRFSAKYCAAMSYALMLLGIVIMMNVGSASPIEILWLYAIFMGVGIGGWAPLSAVLVSSNFGLSNYASVYGTMSMFHGVVGAVSPLFYGYIYDITGSYHWAFVTSIVLHIMSILLILLTKRPKLSSASSG